MKINFYSATSGVPAIVISMELIDGKIKPSATPAYKRMAKDILNTPGLPKGGKPVSAANNPESFLAAMPNTYLGSYFWAEVAK